MLTHQSHPPSDHLPIFVTYKAIKMVSWNLLSDQHLHNKFLNVKGTKYFNRYLSKQSQSTIIDWRFFFSKFGHFLLRQSPVMSGLHQIEVNAALLADFVIDQKQHVANLEKKLNELQSDINGINELEHTLQKERETTHAAQEIIPFITDATHINHDNIKILLEEMIRTHYTIEYCDKWKIRFKILQENKKLIHYLALQDFLCFQECSAPEDMLMLLTDHVKENKLKKHFKMISYKVNEKSLDNCVIIFDEKKYRLKSYHSFGLLLDQKTQKFRKPCLVADFIQNCGTSIIVGSIHHPGGRKNEIQSVIDEIYRLAPKKPFTTDCLALGDYNHTPRFFEQALSTTPFALIMPQKGTMVQNDFGNFNVAIDGVLTNYPEYLQVEVLDELKFASHIELPLTISFNF